MLAVRINFASAITAITSNFHAKYNGLPNSIAMKNKMLNLDLKTILGIEGIYKIVYYASRDEWCNGSRVEIFITKMSQIESFARDLTSFGNENLNLRAITPRKIEAV